MAEPYVVNVSSVQDCAWAAGLIDGEGCIKAYRSGRGNGRAYLTVRLEVRMCHRPTLERLKAIFGGEGSRLHPIKRKTEKHRTAWSWIVTGQGVFSVLQQVRPFMLTKAAEADIAIELLNEQRGQQHRPLTEELEQWRTSRIDRLQELKREEWCLTPTL